MSVFLKHFPRIFIVHSRVFYLIYITVNGKPLTYREEIDIQFN